MEKSKSSILLSIFKRKGGVGEKTSILNDVSVYKEKYDLLETEKIIIEYYNDKTEWALVTNLSLHFCYESQSHSIELSNLKEVKPAMIEELRNGILNANDFTKLRLIDSKGKSYLMSVEEGEPYKGFYQVLSFICANNK